MNEQQQPGRNTTCLEAGQLMAWQDGALPPPKVDEVMAHLVICARCAAEGHALMWDRQHVFGLLTALDPPPGANTEPAPAFARFQKRLFARNTGTFLHHSNGNINPGTFPLSNSEREGSTLPPVRPSIRRHRPGAVAQTLVAAMIIAALLGTTLLLLRAWVPSTGGHPKQAPSIKPNGTVYDFDTQHTHANPPEHILNPTTVGGLTKKWAFETGGTVFTSPAVADGLVYAGCTCGYLYALDADTGAKKWVYSTAGSQVASSPAVVGGVVYVGSIEGHTLYALDAATGAKKWAYQTRGPIISSPAVVGGVVYVGSEDNTLYAFDAATGAKKWTYWTRGGIDSSPAVAGGVVYVGSSDGNMYAFDAATGAKKWAYHTGDFVYSSPAVAGGVVYVGSGDGNVYALDTKSGAKKWAYQTGSPVEASPAVANGLVYVGSHDGTLYALDAATGAKKWTYWTRGPMFSPPDVANGVVYVGAGWDNVYAFDAVSGAKKWAYPTGGLDSSPAVVNGVVYVGALDGNVYAFHLPKRDPSSNGTAHP